MSAPSLNLFTAKFSAKNRDEAPSESDLMPFPPPGIWQLNMEAFPVALLPSPRNVARNGSNHSDQDPGAQLLERPAKDYFSRDASLAPAPRAESIDWFAT